MKKPPSLPNVKYVKRGLRWYAYFNTGQKRDGKPIYAPMPQPGTIGFHDSYASFMAGRTKRKPQQQATVAGLVQEYRQSDAFTKRAENTRKLYNAQLKKVVEFWGDYPIDDLQPADVRMVLDNEGWNAGTRNMVVAVLAVLYKWGRQRSKATIEPTKDIEREKGGEHEPWPEHILRAALECDDPTIRLAVHVLYFTGLRISDAMRLTWNDVRGGSILITPQKTRRFKKTLDIPIHRDLRAELDRTPKAGIAIFHGIKQRWLRTKLQAFTRALGAETVPHGLRKNAVIALLEEGCTVAEVASITGQTFQVVEHYAAQVNKRRLSKAAMLKFEARGRAE
ncbi:tyrosine-type recombinase/integrase [Novosphingobium sp. NPDC080210]|uniref:tyrosine-type recombinase/integrase n=1 Tax=Novosphingobium sp. NPDC080210 TaxID=3390596 RepID=UPI003D05D908